MSDARSYRAILERTEDWAPGTRSLFLRLPAGGGLPFLPGQFVSLSIPAGARPLSRAYSIASPPEEPELLELCLDLVPGGPGSSYLFHLRPGAQLDLTGPWGSFVLEQPAPASCVFIAIGTGIAPIRPMVRAAVAQPELVELHLAYAAPPQSAPLYRAELEQLAGREARFRFEPLNETGADPEHSALYALVEQRWVRGETDRSRHFFVCGVGNIVTRLRDLLRRAGYERRAVRYEKW